MLTRVHFAMHREVFIKLVLAKTSFYLPQQFTFKFLHIVDIAERVDEVIF